MLSPAKKGIPESSLASKSSAWKIQMNFLRCFCWCIPWVCAHLGVWGSVVGRIEHWRGIKGTATTHTAKVRAKQVRAPTGECEHRYFRCDVSAMSVRCIVRVWCLTVRIQGVVCIALGVKNATFCKSQLIIGYEPQPRNLSMKLQASHNDDQLKFIIGVVYKRFTSLEINEINIYLIVETECIIKESSLYVQWNNNFKIWCKKSPINCTLRGLVLSGLACAY